MKQLTRSNKSEPDIYVEEFLPERLEKSLQFLVSLRNRDGGWGRFKDAPSEIRYTAVAIRCLLDCDYENFLAACEEGVQFLVNAIAQLKNHSPNAISSPQLSDLSLMVDSLWKGDGSRCADEVHWCLEEIVSLQVNDGTWSKGGGGIQDTAIAARTLALVDDYFEQASRAISFLLEVQNVNDGGWGVSWGLPSTVGVTSHVLRAMIAGGQALESNAIQNAIRFLYLNQNADGSWSESGDGNVYHTAISVLALMELDISPGNKGIQRAVAYLENIRKDDYGWGWKAGEPSQTEPTAYAISALVATGIKKYVPKTYALTLEADLEKEISLLRQELAQLRSDLDARVREAIPGVVQDRDRLARDLRELQKLYEHETEKYKSGANQTRASMDRLSKLANAQIEYVVSIVTENASAINLDAKKLWTSSRLLELVWLLYGILSATVTFSVIFPIFHRPFWIMPVSIAVAILLTSLTIFTLRAERRRNLAREKAYVNLRLQMESVRDQLPIENMEVESGRLRRPESKRDLDRGLTSVRKTFRRLEMLLSEIPPSTRYEVLQRMSRILDYPPDMQGNGLSELRAITGSMIESMPYSTIRQLDIILYDLSHLDLPSEIIMDEIYRLRERLL